jgi:hypothetical protein
MPRFDHVPMAYGRRPWQYNPFSQTEPKEQGKSPKRQRGYDGDGAPHPQAPKAGREPRLLAVGAPSRRAGKCLRPTDHEVREDNRDRQPADQGPQAGRAWVAVGIPC